MWDTAGRLFSAAGERVPRTSTGSAGGPQQITHTSFSSRCPPRASRASRCRVAARANAATAARHPFLCRFQSLRWHAFPQYHAEWHCAHSARAPTAWQAGSKQQWLPSSALPLVSLMGSDLVVSMILL